MLIRPELQALRGNVALQRQAQMAVQAVVHAWRTTGPGGQVDAELLRFHHGEALSQLPLFSDLYDPHSDACHAFLDRILGSLIRQIAEQPLARSPLPCASSDAFVTLMLAQCATTTLSLQYVSGAALAGRPATKSVSLAPRETWERVVSGSAQAQRIRAREVASDRVVLDFAKVRLDAGEVRYRKGQAEALVLQTVPTSLVQLRLQRRTSMREPAREYSLEDGRMLHQAAGAPRDSRLELTANLLGRMKRRDAAPMLAAMAEELGADSLRWQALRECLALDTAIGFRSLCALADCPDDPLRQPAAALRARLLQMHPELNGICPCPA